VTVSERLLLLYPRAGRRRYGEEFLATLGPGAPSAQQWIDIVSGAIDAWLSADVRRATGAYGIAPEGGSPMTVRSAWVCEGTKRRYTTRDALIGSGVMLGVSLVLVVLGVTARRGGWPLTGELLASLAFPVALTISMPFWLMKGQPWRAQAAIVGGTVLLLVLIGLVASLF
jgi:hypothetical protein